MNEKALNRSEIKKMALTGLMTAVAAALSQISFPLPSGIPVTLQTFGVALAGYILGWKWGAVSMLLYIALGAVGVPVFAGFKGGVSSLVGLTGGFIAGFVLMAALCGVKPGIENKKAEAVIEIVSGLLGIAACHIPGVLWFSRLSGNTVAVSFLKVSLPYLLKDIVSVIGAWLLVRFLKKTGALKGL
ncbi:MAG: biotin transporter BioY [Eubacteriales bacterium]|jgi:biotin transport system substrate-specific component